MMNVNPNSDLYNSIAIPPLPLPLAYELLAPISHQKVCLPFFFSFLYKMKKKTVTLQISVVCQC